MKRPPTPSSKKSLVLCNADASWRKYPLQYARSRIISQVHPISLYPVPNPKNHPISSFSELHSTRSSSCFSKKENPTVFGSECVFLAGERGRKRVGEGLWSDYGEVIEGVLKEDPLGGGRGLIYLFLHTPIRHRLMIRPWWEDSQTVYRERKPLRGAKPLMLREACSNEPRFIHSACRVPISSH